MIAWSIRPASRSSSARIDSTVPASGRGTPDRSTGGPEAPSGPGGGASASSSRSDAKSPRPRHLVPVDRRRRRVDQLVPPAKPPPVAGLVPQTAEQLLGDAGPREVTVQLATSDEAGAQHHRPASGGVQLGAPELEQPLLKLGEVGQLGYGNRHLGKAHPVAGDELHLVDDTVADVHDDGALRLELAGARAPGLAVARVDDVGVARAPAAGQDAALVDVTEREVVEPGTPQVVERAGAVVRVAGRHALDVAVEEANVQAGPRRAGEAQRQVLRRRAGRVADPLDRRQQAALPLDGDDRHLVAAEHRDAVGPGPDGRPAGGDRVVVAVDDEARDAGRSEPGETVAEPELGAKPALGAVVHVAGDEQERRVAFEREVDDGVEGLQRGLAQGVRDEWGHLPDALERCVQVEVGRVDEAERAAIGSHGRRHYRAGVPAAGDGRVVARLGPALLGPARPGGAPGVPPPPTYWAGRATIWRSAPTPAGTVGATAGHCRGSRGRRWALTTTTETFDGERSSVRAATSPPALRVLALVGVVLVAALGLLLRLWALGRWPVSSDEAIVGLMAKEILQGHFSAFYWGQRYGGGEPYVVAALFAVFGRSPFTLGITPVLLDTVAALLVWRIGRRLFPPVVGVGAALLFWIWPETYIWESILEYGFRWMALDCGLVVLLVALRISDGTERPARRVLLDWGVLGLAAGLGWWCTPEIAYYLVPVAALLVWRLAHRRYTVGALDLATAAGAALLGALPWIWANVTSGFSSLASVSQPNPPDPFFEHLKVLGVHVLPTLLGLRLRAAAGSPLAPWVFGTAPGAVLYALVLVAAIAWLVVLVRRRQALVLVAFVVVFPFGYAISPFTWFWADARYAIYLAPVASLLAVSGVRAGLRRLARRSCSPWRSRWQPGSASRSGP